MLPRAHRARPAAGRRPGPIVVRFTALALFGIAALAPPSAASASQVVLTRGRDTLSVERWTRTSQFVDGTLWLRHAFFRAAYTLTLLPDGRVSHLRAHNGDADAPDSTPPRFRTFMDWSGDSVVVRIEPGSTSSVHDAGSALPYVNPSMAMIEQVLRRARRLEGDSVRVAVVEPGESDPVPVLVRWLPNDSASVTIEDLELRFEVGRAGEIRGGAIPSQAIRIFRDELLPGGDAVPTPDYSAPPSAPYRAEEVRVPVADGVTLAGTLTSPTGTASAPPCALLLAGVPGQNRDGAIPDVPGYRPFRQIADALARRGIATLRLDGRGVGGSGGDPGRVTVESLTADARRSLAWLRAQPWLDRGHIAIVAFGEGGTLALALAAESHEARALVLLGAESRSGRRTIEAQNRDLLARDTRVAPAARDSLLAAAMGRLDTLAAGNAWLSQFLAADPLAGIRRVRAPALVIHGANDVQVHSEQADELATALCAAGDRDVTARVLPGLDHLLLPDPSGDPAGYGRLDTPLIPPDVLDAIGDWLAPRLGAPAPRAVSAGRR
ncbi:MAG TPA: CocE/NonD family hydrolase [Candidatus Acidoferrales bacterium]|nr:CocE/NonD family hydrolase [Candidatus Acidoferrales bacterium]